MQEFILERVKIFQYEVCAYLLVKPVLALQNSNGNRIGFFNSKASLSIY